MLYIRALLLSETMALQHLRTMAATFLNYTTLGRNSFEVFSYNVDTNDVQIETVLQQIGLHLEVFHLRSRMEFWLVCEITTLNVRGPIDDRFFPVEGADSL